MLKLKVKKLENSKLTFFYINYFHILVCFLTHVIISELDSDTLIQTTLLTNDNACI